MHIETSFPVKAPPDRVFEFLLDVNRVVGCVPGAELSEVLDPDTFKGKVRIKVGPMTVSYRGTARITARDPTSRSATLEAEGRETTGSGSAQASITMSVVPDAVDSNVTIATEFTVIGRVAQFGRGIMEDVSRHLIGQMAQCVRAELEPPEGVGLAAGGEGIDDRSVSPDGSDAEVPPTLARPSLSSTERLQRSAPLDAFVIARAIAGDRVRRLRAERLVPVVLGTFVAALLLRRALRH